MEHWRTVSRLDSKYAASREEEQQRSFDDSVVQLRPIDWRSRVVKMAPVLPKPQTRLLPGTTRALIVPLSQTLHWVKLSPRNARSTGFATAGLDES
jgi:hypothetical protein